MKPVFGIDITNNKKNEEINSTPFIAATPDDAVAAQLEQLSGEAEETVRSSKLPLVLLIAQYILGGFGALVVACTLSAGLEIGFSKAWENGSVLIVIGIVCFALFLALWLWGRFRSKSVMESDSTARTAQMLDGYAQIIREQLEVPADANKTDVLLFRYQVKNGEICPVSSFPYINFELDLFLRNGCLCFADLAHRCDFPLESLSRITTVKKRISLISWNKEESIKSERYKPYRLTKSDIGFVFCKQYHVLELEHDGERYGIWFPPYELPVFEELTGLRASAEEENQSEETEF